MKYKQKVVRRVPIDPTGKKYKRDDEQEENTVHTNIPEGKTTDGLTTDVRVGNNNAQQVIPSCIINKATTMNLTNLSGGNALLSEHIMPFVGEDSFIFVAGVCRLFRDTYKSYLQQHKQNPKTFTSLNEIISSLLRLQMVMNELNMDINDLYDERKRFRWHLDDGRHYSERLGETNLFYVPIIQCATYNGSLDVLQWIKNHTTKRYRVVWPRLELCNAAANGGKLKVLQWLRSQDGGNYRWDESTCSAAAYGGHLETLMWAKTNGCRWDERTCEYAAHEGHLKVLKWARDNDCPWAASTCGSAAENGHFEVLKWAHQNGCPWDEETCANAAYSGHFEILKWLRQNGCPWDEETCAGAASGGQLEILKWTRGNGCPWSAQTCSNAANNGELEILKWARRNGCPMDIFASVDAVERGHLDTFEWTRLHGSPYDDEDPE